MSVNSSFIKAITSGRLDLVKRIYQENMANQAKSKSGNNNKEGENNQGNIDINAVEKDKTALMLAAERGYVKIVRFLITVAKANVEAMVKVDGLSGNKPFKTAAMFAAEKGHTDVLACLLFEGNANLCALNLGYSALHFALVEDQVEAMRFLLEHGALANVRKVFSDYSSRNTETWKLIAHAQNFITLDLESCTKNVNTAIAELGEQCYHWCNHFYETATKDSLLFKAVSIKHKTLINGLIEAGADIDQQASGKEFSPFDLAHNANQDKYIKALFYIARIKKLLVEEAQDRYSRSDSPSVEKTCTQLFLQQFGKPSRPENLTAAKSQERKVQQENLTLSSGSVASPLDNPTSSEGSIPQFSEDFIDTLDEVLGWAFKAISSLKDEEKNVAVQKLAQILCHRELISLSSAKKLIEPYAEKAPYKGLASSLLFSFSMGSAMIIAPKKNPGVEKKLAAESKDLKEKQEQNALQGKPADSVPNSLDSNQSNSANSNQVQSLDQDDRVELRTNIKHLLNADKEIVERGSLENLLASYMFGPEYSVEGLFGLEHVVGSAGTKINDLSNTESLLILMDAVHDFVEKLKEDYKRLKQEKDALEEQAEQQATMAQNQALNPKHPAAGVQPEAASCAEEDADRASEGSGASVDMLASELLDVQDPGASLANQSGPKAASQSQSGSLLQFTQYIKQAQKPTRTKEQGSHGNPAASAQGAQVVKADPNAKSVQVLAVNKAALNKNSKGKSGAAEAGEELTLKKGSNISI